MEARYGESGWSAGSDRRPAGVDFFTRLEFGVCCSALVHSSEPGGVEVYIFGLSPAWSKPSGFVLTRYLPLRLSLCRQ